MSNPEPEQEDHTEDLLPGETEVPNGFPEFLPDVPYGEETE